MAFILTTTAVMHTKPDIETTSTNIMMIIAASRPIIKYGTGDETRKIALLVIIDRACERCFLGESELAAAEDSSITF